MNEQEAAPEQPDINTMMATINQAMAQVGYAISQIRLPGESRRKFLLRSIEGRLNYGVEADSQSWQRCPYTGVRVEIVHEGRPYIGLGFSKCHWPDPWDENYGWNLARRKAVAEVVRMILGDEEDAHDVSEV